MTDFKQIHTDAKSSFSNGDYFSAFETLLKGGVSDFVAFAEKEIEKINWLTDTKSGNFFWNEYIVLENVFYRFFNSDSNDQLLHNYFFKSQIVSKNLEIKLAKEFPEVLIKAVRVNQAFLQKVRIESVLSLPFNSKYFVHQKVWKFLYDNEVSLWSNVEKELANFETHSLYEILCDCIIWLETNRNNNNSIDFIYQLSTVYGLFIEILFNKYPDKSENLGNEEDFYKQFFAILFSKNKKNNINEKQSVINILSEIQKWIEFKENIIAPYSFDLNIEPVQANDLLFLKSSPESHYKWLLNGVRYNICQLNYLLQGSEFVEYLEFEKEIIISKGKNIGDEDINRNIACFKMSTVLALKDLGIDSFQFGASNIEVEKLLTPLIAYSSNKLIRYESEIINYNSNSNSWTEAFTKLFFNTTRIDGIDRMPFIFISKKDFSELLVTVNKLPEEIPDAIINIFSRNTKPKKGFNRFNPINEVWLNPFLRIGEYLFCPVIFFANNIWFYSFVQQALTSINKTKDTERSETRAMEQYFGNRIEKKDWEVKVVNDREANCINGDVDIIVEDIDTLLFIQLKRTYFRLNLKSIYFESINTDKKAAQQLNKAEKYLEQENSIYTIKKKPVKWIVSTSFENIGEEINGCRKINYFEFLNALNNPNLKNLADLICNLKTDKYLKEFISCTFKEGNLNEVETHISDILKPLKTFESQSYNQPIISDDINKIKNYNLEFYEAIRLDREGKKNEALILFNKCIFLLPNNGNTYGALANTLADMGLFQQSIIAFNKALELLPNDPFITRNYSMVLIESGNYFEGLKLQVIILEKCPLLVEFRQLFIKQFEHCIKLELLNPVQIIELQADWNKLN